MLTRESLGSGNATPEMRVLRYGESAWLIEIDPVEPRTDARAAARARAALARAYPQADVVSGGASVLIASRAALDAESIERVVAGAFELAGTSALLATPREHVIDVVYDGPDLERIAEASGQSRRQAIELHQREQYGVEVVGFLPGFAYLGEVDERLRVPRLGTPRRVVPAGSVGIAGRYTAIYPSASPGGWSLIGRALNPHLFDPSRDPPGRLQVGDAVRFREVEDHLAPSTAVLSDDSTTLESKLSAPAIEILGASHATIQDLGRHLRSRGIPRSGPLDEETHRAANRAVCNLDTAATIEIPLDGMTLRALGQLTFSIDGELPVEARVGETIRVVPTDRAVRYLAIRGGIEVPLILGSRSTLLSAGLGGMHGRRLRRGDRLQVGAMLGEMSEAAPAELAMSEEIALVPLADALSPQALEDLCGAVRTVSTASDRIGTRLEGPPVRREKADPSSPQPVLPGAVQITPDGAPIVLGPDCAVTGGYPVVGVLTEHGRARFARIRPGGRVRFVVSASG